MISVFSCLPVILPKSYEIDLIMNDDNRLMLPYKLAKLNSKNDILTQEWYIEFWAWSQSENKLKRKRLTSLNSIEKLEDRKEYAFKVINQINNMLLAGAHFDKLEVEKKKNQEHRNKIVKHVNIIEYLNGVLEENKNKYNGRTYSDIKHDIKVFKGFINFKKYEYLGFEDLEKVHCMQYQTYLLNKGYAGKTINSRMSTIGTFYNSAVKLKSNFINPFAGIDRIKEVKNGINKALDDKDIKRVKDVLENNYPMVWLACMFMFYCFLRPNEIRQLKIKNVNLLNKKIYVHSIVSKNKKSSMVDIPNPLIKILEKYLENKNNIEMYLISVENRPSLKMSGRNYLGLTYKNAVKSLNLDSELTFYSWKHTGVCKAFKSGIDIKALQFQGRWHNLEMVDKYLKSLGLIENKNFTSIMNNLEL